MVRNIINNSNKYLTALAMCAVVASCTTNEDIAQEEEKTSSELSCTAKEILSEDELSSRSSLTLGGGGMQFAWEDGDVMTVMAKDDNRARQLYTLQSGIGSPDAKFFADNFRLKEKQLYFAFSKQENNQTIKIPDQNNITVDYAGQIQVGNASSNHLGNYDYMAAGTVCTDENSTHFYFDHLGATLRVIMKFDDTSIFSGDEKTALDATNDDGTIKRTRFTEMEIYDSENSFRQTKRNFSFATGTNADGTYTFKWPEQEITGMDRFKVTLMNETEAAADPTAYTGPKGITRCDQYVEGGTNSKNRVIVYMEVPPADFTNKKLGVMLKGYYMKGSEKHDVSYVASYDQGWVFGNATTYKVDAGKACQVSVPMKKPEKFDISLKVNHMWQHGSTLDETVLTSKAGTGDPGYDKEIVTPTHIYYIYCHDGKVVAPKDGGAAVTHITASGTNDWETTSTDGVWVSTYKGGTTNGIITLDKPECKKATKDEKCEYHLYVAASTSQLTISANVGDTEESIRGKLYNLPGSGVQTFMRDLYSTPWDATSFVGNITDPVQDVILYHVAAKVDLKWNSATAVGTIYADNVKKLNLFLFQPTQNLDGVLEEGGYSDLWTMPSDQQSNGRYILYLPQFKTADNNNCSYKIGLGDHASQPITFTPISTQGGFTSWLRWLKKQ